MQLRVLRVDVFDKLLGPHEEVRHLAVPWGKICHRLPWGYPSAHRPCPREFLIAQLFKAPARLFDERFKRVEAGQGLAGNRIVDKEQGHRVPVRAQRYQSGLQ